MAGNIVIVGLGSGGGEQLTLGIWNRLKTASHCVARTEQHPAVDFLRAEGINVESFDHVYEACDSFPEVYEAITSQLLKLANRLQEEETVIYAVPGHPMVAEQSVQLLRERCAKENIVLEVLGGESFLDQAFTRLGFDPIEGFQLLDGTALDFSKLNPLQHTLIGQVYDADVASEVKLTLMELYPDDYPVTVAHALGIAGEERILTIPLFELDRVEGYGNLSLIWLPKDDSDRLLNRTFIQLQRIVRTLREPGGCPWDQEQTHASIRKNLIEETYEVLETIDDDDPDAMREELGDLLLQVMLHAQMESEAGTFNVFDVIEGLNEKLIRRHPHVFGDSRANNAEDALQNWQAIKEEEKRKKGIWPEEISALAGVPRELPGLMKAYKLQKKAAAVGFDWDRLEDVLAKVDEELQELRVAISDKDADLETKAELGDVLFSLVNTARFLKIDPEEALALTNRKFIQRFEYIEAQLRIKGQKIEQTSLIELEKYWQEAKNRPASP